MAKSPKQSKSIEAIKHADAKRKNIPTAVPGGDQGRAEGSDPRAVPRRNKDLDPQLMWRGKDEHEIRVAGEPVELRRREWVVLERLVVRVGKVVSKERLSAEVFGFDDAVAPNAIEVYIARLRRKLGPQGPTIRTMRGLGYVMENVPAGEA